VTVQPLVGIVTRTKNRRVLLKRALESVLYQSYPNWQMVIVNDGGDRDDVDALVAGYADLSGGRVRVVHNARSLGMEGASKVGLAGLETDLLIMHDDDDSWAPEFLAVTTRELQQLQASYPAVQGVTTYANLVMEQVNGNLVHTDSIEPFNAWVPPGFLSLDRMLASNFIPPISFLFSRLAYEDLGGVYEAIPYLGDWDFLIRFLSKYEVCMIPQYLAFYHWRSGSRTGVFANSVTGEIGRHKFYRQMLLNQWLRADIAAGRFGIGAYANLRGHIEMFAKDRERDRELAPPAPAPAPAPAHATAPAPAAEAPDAGAGAATAAATNGELPRSTPAGGRVRRALRRITSWGRVAP
jgi:glycosyltransferase involved in cell wall biosynthesis